MARKKLRIESKQRIVRRRSQEECDGRQNWGQVKRKVEDLGRRMTRRGTGDGERGSSEREGERGTGESRKENVVAGKGRESPWRKKMGGLLFWREGREWARKRCVKDRGIWPIGDRRIRKGEECSNQKGFVLGKSLLIIDGRNVRGGNLVY